MIRGYLRGEKFVRAEDSFEIVRSLPHGHVAAALGVFRQSGLEHVIASKVSQQRDLVAAMIVSRIIEPCSKLATARGLGVETQFSSLGEALQLEEVDENSLYGAMDWLLARQKKIEAGLAKEHFAEGSLVFYDVSSSYFEGRTCSLARMGHNRDGDNGQPQIVYGLLCNEEGCPVAVEVFEGNTSDPKTFTEQVSKVRKRFRLKRVVMVGDRGMITQARIREDLAGIEGLDWITALRAPSIRLLLESGTIQLSLFDRTDLAEITHPDYPGERLIACKNPLLAEERRRKREDLLNATEKELQAVVLATQRARAPLRGKDKIALRVGRMINHYKVAKHFILDIREDSFSFKRNQENIDQEKALDGIYVIRTSLSTKVLEAERTVAAYKNLSVVERAFRSLKTVDLKVRPIFHRLADRVRAHIFLCMLAYYIEWHMRKALAPLLFDDDDKQAAKALRTSIVAPAKRSPRALAKASSRKNHEGLPVHSFQTLIHDLATLTKNHVRTADTTETFQMLSTPTPLQRRAFELLNVPVKL